MKKEVYMNERERKWLETYEKCAKGQGAIIKVPPWMDMRRAAELLNQEVIIMTISDEAKNLECPHCKIIYGALTPAETESRLKTMAEEIIELRKEVNVLKEPRISQCFIGE